MDFQACIAGLQASGLSVNQIADEIGVTGNAVREVIAGRTKAPRAHAVLKLLALCAQRGVDAGNPLDEPERTEHGGGEAGVGTM